MLFFGQCAKQREDLRHAVSTNDMISTIPQSSSDMTFFRGEELCTTADIEVDQLFYAQRTIGSNFKCGRRMIDLVSALDAGEVRLDDSFLTLRVVERKIQGGTSRFFSTDNRRLWCLKRFKELRKQQVFVKCRLMKYEGLRHLRTNDQHFDTINDGTSIEVRPCWP